MKPPEIVTATRSELDAILALVEPVLPPPQYQLLQGVLQTLEFLMLRLQDARLSLRRLQRMLFGATTERQRDVVKVSTEGVAASAQSQAPADAAPQPPAEAVPDAAPDAPASPPHKRKGHGRHGAAAYAGATVVECAHQELQSGQLCPQCEKGKVYASPPKVIVKVVGQAPLAATVYRVQRLRCRLCDGHVGLVPVDQRFHVVVNHYVAFAAPLANHVQQPDPVAVHQFVLEVAQPCRAHLGQQQPGRHAQHQHQAQPPGVGGVGQLHQLGHHTRPTAHL